MNGLPWIERTEKTSCLCCGQTVHVPGRPINDAEHAQKMAALLLALGYTTKSLLTTHRAQLDYQLPGMAFWLSGELQ